MISTAPAPSPSGLTREELADLTPADLRALYAWMRGKTGAGGFIPQAIRRMPLEARLQLARSPALDRLWEQREIQRVRKSETYFIESYGSVQPPVGPPIPFELWPAQRHALGVIRRTIKSIVLKARRLGLSWLTLHYGFWIAAFSPEHPGARVLVVAKHKEDSGKLLDRMKKINDRLPPFLRQQTGRDSRTGLELVGRGAELWALPATESAGRMETATLVVLDEFAFPRNGVAGDLWTAIQPTIEGGGQLVVISTGNGRTGDGETFADLWDKAIAGLSSIVPIFLPWSARPDRTAEWREAQRADYLRNEDFEAEYPDDPEQALAGDVNVHVYPHSGIGAAERIGAELAELPIMAELIAEGFGLGTDWGDFQTFTVFGLALPGGGIFIYDELAQAHVEPSKASEAIVSHEPGGISEPVFNESRADASPAGTNATFASVLDLHRREHPGRFPETHWRIPFGVYKEGGGDRKGINTVAYLRMLFEKSAEIVGAWGGDPSNLHGAIAIHPRCETLLAQLRNLERDPETAKVKKPSLDPKNPLKGDHGPDALVAFAAPRAAAWLASRETEEVEA
jgi:hypothetical protein